MIREYESLKKVLSTIEVKEGLNKDNIIEKIKTELEEQNLFLYSWWKIGNFDVSYVFSFSFCIECPLLTIAAENCHTNIVKVLIQAGADVNAVSQYGKTPLDYTKSQDVVKALLEAGGGSFVKARNKQ